MPDAAKPDQHPARWPGTGPARVAWTAGYADEPLVVELMAPDGNTLQARMVIMPGYQLVVGKRPGYMPDATVLPITADDEAWTTYEGPPADFVTPTVPGVITTGPSSTKHLSSVSGADSSERAARSVCVVCGASVVQIGSVWHHEVPQPHQHDADPF